MRQRCASACALVVPRARGCHAPRRSAREEPSVVPCQPSSLSSPQTPMTRAQAQLLFKRRHNSGHYLDRTPVTSCTSAPKSRASLEPAVTSPPAAPPSGIIMRASAGTTPTWPSGNSLTNPRFRHPSPAHSYLAASPRVGYAAGSLRSCPRSARLVASDPGHPRRLIPETGATPNKRPTAGGVNGCRGHPTGGARSGGWPPSRCVGRDNARSERLPRSRSCGPRLELSRQGGHNLEEVANKPQVGEAKHGGLRVVVDGHDVLRGLNAGLVLDRAGDAASDVELR